MTREAAKWKKEIIAFLDGKKIEQQHIYGSPKVWFNSTYPNFDSEFYRFRIEPEPNEVIEYSKDGHLWFSEDQWPTPNCAYFKRTRIINPNPTKRLPTIEEVEAWFMENKVFKSNCGRYLQKISSLHRAPINTLYISIGCGSLTIKDLVSHYKHYNGSELYITEN